MGFIHIGIIDIIDIFVVATLIYYVYRLVRGTSASSIITGILIIYILWLIVKTLNMELLSSILGSLVSVGLIAVLVIFQPEIRHFLEHLGERWVSENRFLRKLMSGSETASDVRHDALSPIVEACADMSAQKTGALIVIRKSGKLADVIETGVRLNAVISAPLLENIFFKNSPLHDGAVIIGGSRIIAAKCILPSTSSQNVPFSFGMRHRAALGMGEASDAVIVVVSEETGGITVVHHTTTYRNVSAANLKERLKDLLTPDEKQ